MFYFILLLLFLLTIYCLHKNSLKRFILSFTILIFFFPFQITSFYYGSWSSLGTLPFVCYFSLFFCLLITFKVKKIKLDPSIYIFIFFVTYIFLLCFYIDGKVPAVIFGNYVTPFFVYLYLRNQRLTFSNFILVKSIIGICIFIFAIWGTLEFFLAFEPYKIFYEMTPFTSEALKSINYSRISFGHPLLVASSIVILYFGRPYFSRNLKINILVLFSLILVMIYSTSRAGILLMFFIILLDAIRNKRMKFKVITLGSFFLFVPLLYMGSLFDEVILKNELDTGTSSDTRLLLLPMIKHLFSADMIFGHGYNLTTFHQVLSQNIHFFSTSEIPWFNIVIEMGLIGLLMVAVCFYLSIKKMGCHKKDLRMIFFVFLMVSSFNSITSPSILPFLFILIFWLNQHTFVYGLRKQKIIY